MRPLTDHTPKPLLEVGGKPLIVWHLEKLAKAGFQRVVINHAHLGEQLVHALGDGDQFGLQILYSAEPEGALETAGGIVKALPLLQSDTFLVVNGDVWCDLDFGQFSTLNPNTLAQLVLVPNPEHHPRGDFVLLNQQVLPATSAANTYTYAGIGLYSAELFAGLTTGSKPKHQPLAPLLRQAIAQRQVQGVLHSGLWCDVGTPARLAQLNQQWELS